MNKSEQKRLDELHRKRLRALKFQGMSGKTINGNARAVRRIAAWFDCYPHRLEHERWAVRVFPGPGRFIPHQRSPQRTPASVSGRGWPGSRSGTSQCHRPRELRSLVSCARPTPVHKTRRDPIPRRPHPPAQFLMLTNRNHPTDSLAFLNCGCRCVFNWPC